MEWTTPEYQHHEKSREWYAIAGVIIFGVLVAEIILRDVLLIILTILGTIAFLLIGMRHPKDIHVEISSGGIRIDEEPHPFPSIQAFAVVESIGGYKLILQSTKRFTPYMIVPLAHDVDPHEVRDLLVKKLPEEDLHEPFSHLLFERLGF
jgi:hypothetical protein